MKIVRAKHQNEIFYGELIDDKVVRYEGSPLVVWESTEEIYELDEIELLAPVLPSKVVAVAKNYAKHAEEMVKLSQGIDTVLVLGNTEISGREAKEIANWIKTEIPKFNGIDLNFSFQQYKKKFIDCFDF